MTPHHAPVVTEHPRLVILAVSGGQCGELWKHIEPRFTAGRSGVVVDLAGTTFLDSVNIAALISIRNKTHAGGRYFAVANLAPNIQAVFRILKLDRMFPLGQSLDQALAAAPV